MYSQNKHLKASDEVSQMWFLIKVLRKNFSNSKSKIEVEYFVVASNDLVESESTRTQAEGFVYFINGERILEGKVIFSSDDRAAIEQRMHRLTATATMTNVIKREKTKFFLVQFSKGTKDVIHAIVPEKYVSWPPSIQPNQREVIVYDGQEKRVAAILYMHEDKATLMAEFQKLKTTCFEMGFDEDDNELTIGNDAWILALYTCGPYNIVYTVLNQRDTYWQRGNPYKDVVTYLTNGQQVFQAIIIRKSNNINELHCKLNRIKSSCLSMDFPLKIDSDESIALPPSNFQSLCGTTETFEKFAGESNPYAELEPSLHVLEERMKEEAAMLIESLDVLENAKRTLEQRKAIISNVAGS